VAQSKTTASGQRVPNFGFVVFEEERAVSECLRDKPILLNGGHRLNVETKKNKPMVRSDLLMLIYFSCLKPKIQSHSVGLIFVQK
jgi:hypothetical protein